MVSPDDLLKAAELLQVLNYLSKSLEIKKHALDKPNFTFSPSSETFIFYIYCFFVKAAEAEYAHEEIR